MTPAKGLSWPCPACKAKPGQRCKRPDGTPRPMCKSRGMPTTIQEKARAPQKACSHCGSVKAVLAVLWIRVRCDGRSSEAADRQKAACSGPNCPGCVFRSAEDASGNKMRFFTA